VIEIYVRDASNDYIAIANNESLVIEVHGLDPVGLPT